MADLVLLSWPLWIWVCAVAVTLVAGVIRGLAGFGFALIFIGAMTLVSVPAETVPLGTILDLVAGLHLVSGARRDADWQGLRWLGAGCLLGVPIGVAVLVNLDQEMLRLAIAVAILISVAGIMSGFRFAYAPGPRLLAGTGFLSGMMSGGGGIPGPPVIIVYLSSPLPMRTTRANTIVLFVLIDAVALALMAWNGLVVTETLLRAGVLFVATVAGASIGSRLFGVVDPAHVRRGALVMLAVLAIVGILRVLLD